MSAPPYIRYDPGLGQLDAGPSLNGGAGGGAAYPYLRASAATDGAETLTVLTKTLAPGGALWFSARALAKTPDGASVASLAIEGRASLAVGGGPVAAVYTDASSAAAPPELGALAFEMVPAGAGAAVRVTGAAGTAVNWRVALEYDEE